MTDGNRGGSHDPDNYKAFGSFAEFYPFYLSEHSDALNRRLHFAGCLLVIATVVYAIVSREWLFLILAPVFGYGFAWIGHFFIEKNRPATFTHPLWSLMGDWKMFGEILSGKIKL